MVFVHKESIYMYFLYSYYICIWREAGGLLMVFVHKESSESSYSIYSIFFSIFIFILVFTRWGDSSREGASLSMVFVHKESSLTDGDAVGLDRDARSKIAFPISW